MKGLIEATISAIIRNGYSSKGHCNYERVTTSMKGVTTSRTLLFHELGTTYKKLL